MLREHKKINMKKNKLHEHKETAQIQKATKTKKMQHKHKKYNMSHSQKERNNMKTA